MGGKGSKEIIGHISFDIFHLRFVRTALLARDKMTTDKCQMIYDQWFWLFPCSPFAPFGKTERPMSDIGLSRLAETFSLKVTVLTPVTAPVGAFYPLLARRQ